MFETAHTTLLGFGSFGWMAETQNQPNDAGQRVLDAELVPLSVAARVAYFQLTGVIHQLDDAAKAGLVEVVQLAALALSQVAPILRENGQALTAQEISAVFISPRTEIPDLDAFRIRRGDFRAALTTLQQARTSGMR